ncbi:MAG: hypothetical protein QNJ94_18635 [Alphaproteobacteria bacterium]|nr:hypothetical protein [Alphaproteobacteria bacterium]
MNIDDMKVGELKTLVAALSGSARSIDNGMIGKYVIVRCRDAGVHAGVLESHNGRECVLNEARRLWYWKPANNAAFLSGVATEGLNSKSKVGAPIRVHLTENCEIIECTAEAADSIRAHEAYSA